MFIISPVTAQQIAGLKAALALQGTTVEAITPSMTPGKYSIYGHGLRANALFDVGDSSLVITITQKPLFAKESHFKEELVEELAKIAKASVPPAPAPVAAPLS